MRLALYAAVLVAGFVGVSLLVFWLAVRPPRLTVPLAPRDFGLAVEDVTITTDDGLKLAAWLVPRPGAPAVILLHGYPADRADMLPIAAGLASRFTVLLLDQRYFGRSEGRLTTLGFKERRDLGRALDFLATRGVGAVGVFGFSLGGAVALLAAAEDPRIRAVSAYAPFAARRLLGTVLSAWCGPLKYPLVGMTRVWSRLFVGDDITRPAPVEAAATLTVPVLLVASRADEQIPFAHAERLREALAANPRAEFVFTARSEEHTSELQSHHDLVC